MNAKLNQASPPELDIQVGKKREALAYLQPVLLETRHGVNQIAGAKLILVAPEGTMSNLKEHAQDAARCAVGADIVIKTKSGVVLFSGVVVQQECRLQRDRAELVLKLRHPLQRLTVSHRSQLFEKKTDADILRALLKEHRIDLGRVAGLGVTHPQLIQFACSDWQFVKTRLHANGVWLLPTEKGVDVIQPKLAAKADHTLQAEASQLAPGVLEEAHWRFSSEDQPKKLEVAAWDITQQAMSRTALAKAPAIGSGGLDPARLTTLSDLPWELLSSMPMAADEQTALAAARLLAQHAQGVQASFTVMGSTAYSVGETLALSGFGSHFDGAGIITEIRHQMSQGLWRTTLSLGCDCARGIDTALLPSVPSGLHIGVVDSYAKDAANLDRLRVTVPALKLGKKALWARFAAPTPARTAACAYTRKPAMKSCSVFLKTTRVIPSSWAPCTTRRTRRRIRPAPTTRSRRCASAKATTSRS